MKIFSLLFGDDVILEQRKVETERQIREEQGRLNNAVQNVHSGSRVMENMAGMMALMNTVERIPDDR